jgi:hypothetical protein
MPFIEPAADAVLPFEPPKQARAPRQMQTTPKYRGKRSPKGGRDPGHDALLRCWCEREPSDMQRGYRLRPSVSTSVARCFSPLARLPMTRSPSHGAGGTLADIFASGRSPAPGRRLTDPRAASPAAAATASEAPAPGDPGSRCRDSLRETRLGRERRQIVDETDLALHERSALPLCRASERLAEGKRRHVAAEAL